MATITKKDMIERITERTKESRLVVRAVMQEFLEQVIVELKKGNRIEFRDFGVFEARRRAARTAQNPKTLKRVEVPSRVAVKFKVGRLMRETLERAVKAPVTPAQAAAELKQAVEDGKPAPKA
jgi:integration host factor subunit beta